MELKFKKLRPDAIIPTRGTPDSAGLDLCVTLPEAGTEIKIHNGHSILPVNRAFESLETVATEIVRFDAIERKNYITLAPHSTMLIPTGLAVEPSRADVALLVYPRSGLAVKKGLILANSVAVIDSDYRGEIQIPLYNNSNQSIAIHSGDRVAQLIVTPVLFPAVTITTDELSETMRGSGGFGSTGVTVKKDESETKLPSDDDFYSRMSNCQLRIDMDSAEIIRNEDKPQIRIRISWGDWKHDHAYLVGLMRDLYPFTGHTEVVTEENGSDCYSAVHTFIYDTM